MTTKTINRMIAAWGAVAIFSTAGLVGLGATAFKLSRKSFGTNTPVYRSMRIAGEAIPFSETIDLKILERSIKADNLYVITTKNDSINFCVYDDKKDTYTGIYSGKSFKTAYDASIGFFRDSNGLVINTIETIENYLKEKNISSLAASDIGDYQALFETGVCTTVEKTPILERTIVMPHAKSSGDTIRINEIGLTNGNPKKLVYLDYKKSAIICAITGEVIGAITEERLNSGVIETFSLQTDLNSSGVLGHKMVDVLNALVDMGSNVYTESQNQK